MYTHKHIWIVNPFDQLPNESDIPLRFWSLCKELAKNGYNVTWWSSDFSHQNKTIRFPCPATDGFSIKLIKTPPYKKNISLSRIRSHRTFAKNFYIEAINKLKKNILEKPFRIVISLPPLGVAESAFKIRDYINKETAKDSKNSKLFCEVVVDIMDAWPEVFYRTFPYKLKYLLAPLLLYPFHISAMFAYKRADKISAVGQSYLEIANNYLRNHQKFFFTVPNSKKIQKNLDFDKPTHLCYHGVDLYRFDAEIILNRSNKYKKLNKKIKLYNSKNIIFNNTEKEFLQIVYIGTMNSGYDLQTIINVVDKWRNEGGIPLHVHFAGTGDQLEKLKLKTKELGLLESRDVKKQKNKVVFHGHLKNDELNHLLISSDIALVTNRSETLVACPYKAGEYAGAGLPMISCLNGEFNNLLHEWNAGLSYHPESIPSLYNAIKKYSTDLELLNNQSTNSRKMAEYFFDREKTYKKFSKFIVNNV